MFEWLTRNTEPGGKTALNILWNFFGGSIMACIFLWPFALVAGRDDPIEGAEFLFKPFG